MSMSHIMRVLVLAALVSGVSATAMPRLAEASPIELPGTDTFAIESQMTLQVGLETYSLNLTGSTSMQRSAAYVPSGGPIPIGGSTPVIDIEIVALSLTGFDANLGAVTIILGDPTSIGRLTNLNVMPGGSWWAPASELISASSVFDAFLTIDVPGLGLVLQNPLSSAISFSGEIDGPLPLSPAEDGWSYTPEASWVPGSPNLSSLYVDANVDGDGMLVGSVPLSAPALLESFTITAIPEPSTAFLVLIGCVFLAAGRSGRQPNN